MALKSKMMLLYNRKNFNDDTLALSRCVIKYSFFTRCKKYATTIQQMTRNKKESVDRGKFSQIAASL